MLQERTTIEETHTTEIKTIKNSFNKEVENLRKALDKQSSNNSRLQINSDKAERDAKEAKAELVTKTKNLEKADRDLKTLQELYISLKNKSDNDEKELSLLKPEYEILKKKHEDAKTSLEDETIKRVDLQNEIMSLEESMKFENQMLEQQLNETRTKKQMEISELDGRLNEEYEAKLQKSLYVSTLDSFFDKFQNF